MDSLMVERQQKTSLKHTQMYDDGSCSSRECERNDDYHDDKRDEHNRNHMSVSSDPESSCGTSASGARNMSMLYHGTWPVERAMWNSEPPSLNQHNQLHLANQSDMTSVMSFASSSGAAPLDKVLNGESECSNRASSQQHLDVKVDMVYSLLSMLGTQECPDMAETLLALSSSPESSLAMREAGCLPILVQLLYSEKDLETREKASQALYNLVQVQPEDKLKKRELKVWRLLEEIRSYCNAVTEMLEKECVDETVANNHPSQVTENIIKLSFDEGYRKTICELGGIYSLAHLVEIDHLVHTKKLDSDQCITLRRYAGMALTNLTFGHSKNKELLCSFRDFMSCLVVQLKSNSDELRQVTASVLRNLSWRADDSSRLILREVGSVGALMQAAIVSRKESTLKSILSALWNLSAHCSMNKADICSVDGALGFLVDMLSYKAPSKTLTIIENVGGILRNVSSHIAIREDYRTILREHNCLQVLLQQLKSPSLTIVSNACGTLWNLSAKCAEDQKALWDMGAAPMLRSLNHSKHFMIATGSRAALKNLLGSRPSHSLFSHVDNTAKELGLPALPTLGARKQRALAKDLDHNLAETCENIEPTSPPHREYHLAHKFQFPSQDECEITATTTTAHSIKRTQDQTNFIESFSNLNISGGSNSKTQVNNTSAYPTTTTTCSSSLSAITTTTRTRNKYPYGDGQEDTEEPVDYSQKYSKDEEEPIDYSKKYSETSTTIPVSPKADLSEEQPIDYSRKYSVRQVVATKCTKTDYYAETDLDQPTDYSLRYAENDSDSECKTQFYEEPDTVKTYCTEGTPYETPYNFSNATSMSDLRLDSHAEEEENKKTRPARTISETNNEKDTTLSAKEQKLKHQETTDLDIDTKAAEQNKNQKLKSCYSSGLMTPEKPVNYCEEGTPGTFSRVSSFSSLNMEDPGTETKQVQIKNESIKREHDEPAIIDNSLINHVKIECEIEKSDEAGAAGKVVTFDRVVDYAEETPLMFSRCSSLGSLSSTEQHSIHDDRSSIISDFSRLTSGIISPSEIPDSPTQTVPPSPRHHKAPLEFPSVAESSQRPTQTEAQESVFEDHLIKYKEVNTPVEFSTNTSLSSLTIDDEPTVNSIMAFHLIQDVILESDSSVNKSDKSTNNESSGSGADLAPVSEGEEEAEDDMLAACINIGMQNNRHIQNKQQSVPKHRSALPKYQPPVHTGIPIKCSSSKDPRSRLNELNTDSTRIYYTEDTPAMLSHAGSNSDLSVLSICSKDKSATAIVDDKPEFSDDSSSNLSGDNDNMLAECIQSGMPKARRQLVTPKIVTRPVKGRDVENLQQRVFKNVSYIGDEAKDEVESYAVEDSPCHFSLRSSLSDLTVDGGNTAVGLQRVKTDRELFEKPRRDCDPYTSPEYMTTSGQDIRVKSPDPNSYSNAGNYRDEPIPALSRADSLSSLSVESYGSTENAEQALLEQCISSGMPKSKNPSSKIVAMTKTKPASVKHECSNNSSKLPIASTSSKNVYVASVVTNTLTMLQPQQQLTSRTTGVTKHTPGPDHTHTIDTSIDEDNQIELANIDQNKLLIQPLKNGYDQRLIIKDTTLNIENEHYSNIYEEKEENVENFLTYDIKTDYVTSNKCSDLLLDGSIEENISPDISDSEKRAQNRMLDPDAMIKSLDRFTAELVSQSSHLQHSQQHDCKLDNMMQSQSLNECGTGGNDTWNDDTSPNDVSFPSISISVPLAASFKSDIIEDTIDPLEPNQFSSFSTMTDSTLIAIEATKVANVVRSEGYLMKQSMTSVTSLELDEIRPPSAMENLISLTSSVSELKEPATSVSAKNSPLASRKKSLPIGLMVRRALNHTHNTKSLENLVDTANNISSSCNLDHIKPPSVMGDYLDMIDMENSMVSVASISSEADFIPNGLMKQQLSTHCYSITDIENINPPSLLNEVTDMCNSTADIVTDNAYSETEIYEDCFTHNTMDCTLRNDDDLADVTEYSDANSLTPIQSDFATSSAESTPKKVKSLNRLTPKQRRQLAKERYKTYTVAAEMVIREEYKTTMEEACSPDSTITNLDNNQSSSSLNSSCYVTAPAPTLTSKLTPKERRMLDRGRFETRVLDEVPSTLFVPPQCLPEAAASSTSFETSTPPLSNLELRKTMRQKRIENADRFRTRTLSSDESSPDQSIPPTVDTRRNLPNDDIHLILEKEANKILDSLKFNNNHDELLDCETLSLVSNDDESEHNSVSSINYRTYHKSWGFTKNLPVVQSQSTTDISKPALAPIITSKLPVVNIAKAQVPINDDSELEQAETEIPKIVKTKIVKPELEHTEDIVQEEVVVKGIRGRRKPLYSAPSKKLIQTSRNMKPIKTMTSNLLKNVTSTLKRTTTPVNNKKPARQNTASAQHTASKPPVAVTLVQNRTSKIQAPKITHSLQPKQLRKQPEITPPRPLERQGTFTKEDKKSKIPESKIPTTATTSKIARAVPAKIPPPSPSKTIPKYSNSKIQHKSISSTSTLENKSTTTFYSNRSPSVDRDFGYKRKTTAMHGSSSSQSLQSTDGTVTTKLSYTSKRSSIPNMTQRSNSNVSITSTGSTSTSSGNKKHVASKIACLWKRNNTSDTKKPKQPTPSTSNRSSHFGSNVNVVKLRENKTTTANASEKQPKRLSRLGSFIQVEEIAA